MLLVTSVESKTGMKRPCKVFQASAESNLRVASYTGLITHAWVENRKCGEQPEGTELQTEV